MELKASTAIILMITGLVFATLACRQASAVLVTPSIISTPTTALIPTVQPTPADISRLSTIPADAVKMSPADDAWPPIVGPGWSQPVPLDKPINTATIFYPNLDLFKL